MLEVISMRFPGLTQALGSGAAAPPSPWDPPRSSQPGISPPLLVCLPPSALTWMFLCSQPETANGKTKPLCSMAEGAADFCGGKHTSHDGKQKASPVAGRLLQQHGMRSLGETSRNFLKVKLWLQEGAEEIFQAAKRSPRCCSEQREPARLCFRAFETENPPGKREKWHKGRAPGLSPAESSDSTQGRAPAGPCTAWPRWPHWSGQHEEGTGLWPSRWGHLPHGS